MDKKVLITYFSWGGNTKSAAEKILEKTGGDILQLETLTPYPNDYHDASLIAKKEIQDKNYPELKEIKNVKDYDVIFIGTPVWWYTMAPAVYSFIEKANKEGGFEGKKVMPFITHGGGNVYNIPQEMTELLKGAEVLSPLIIYGKGDKRTENEIEAWIKQIK